MSGSKSHAPRVGFSQSQFFFFACESSHGRKSEHAELPREVATHLGAHDESSTTGVAAHLWASALARARKH